MIQELIKAFILVFIAEIGDKSQILAMTFAAQYKANQVVGGVFIGIVLNHLLAILIGVYISNIIPMDYIQLLAGFMFIIFGFTALKKDNENNNGSNKIKLGVIAGIAVAFFIGELGDKTQLTAMTLAMESKYPIIILLGTTSAMLVVACIGIFIIKAFNKSIPKMLIKIVSGTVFIILGLSKLYTMMNNIFDNKMLAAAVIIIVMLKSLSMSSKLIESN